jgi:hypothetical protein
LDQINWNSVHILDRTLEMTYDIEFVDQVTGSAGFATKVATWVRMSSIGPNELKLGWHTCNSNRNDIWHYACGPSYVDVLDVPQKVKYWVRMSSIEPNELKFGTHTC